MTMISSLMGSGTAQPTCRRNEWPKNRMASDRPACADHAGHRIQLRSAAAVLLRDGVGRCRLVRGTARRRWSLSKTLAPRIFSMLSGAVDDWLDGIPRRSSPASQPRTLVVAKSLSTFIYPHVSRLGVPMALLTPVLSPADFDPTRSSSPCRAMTITSPARLPNR